MTRYIRDEIARLRAEAAQFRKHAHYARLAVQREPNPVGRLQWRSRVTEYVRAAQERDRLARELRAQHSPAKVPQSAR
jgi:hypothetical protein